MLKKSPISWKHLGILALAAAISTPLFPSSDIREVELPGPPSAGPGRIPHHHSSVPLEQLAEQSKTASFSSTALQFRQWIKNRRGALVLPPFGLRVGSRGTILIPPTETTMSQWSKSVSPEFLDLSLQSLNQIPIDGVHPFLWQQNKEELAKRALAEAVENGDRATAVTLLRRQGLDIGEDPGILSWIYKNEPRDTYWQRTDTPGELNFKTSKNTFVEALTPLSLIETGPDRALVSRGGFQTRRQPLVDFHPLRQKDTILCGSGIEVLALDLNDSLKPLWTWTRHPDEKPHRFPPLVSVPETPVSSGNRCVFLLRTPRHFQRPATNVLIENGPWKDAGWLEAVVLEIPDPRLPPVSSWSPPIAQEGFSASPTPHIEGDRLWLVATRGWSEMETWVFAFDLTQKKELWRRKLFVEQFEAHSLEDLRDKIAMTTIALQNDDLVISRSGGAVELLSASMGEHRATLHLPRWFTTELPSHSGIRWANNRFRAYPRIRPRYHSSISVPRSPSEPWLLLPADGKMLIALEKDNWRIRWSRPASRETSFLGIKNSTAWIIDSGVLHGEQNISLVGIDPKYGNVIAGPWDLKIVASTSSTDDEKPEIAPLLRGLPRLVNDQLWLPTASGVQTFSISDGTQRELIPWPAGSAGGTPLPLEDGRMLLFRRGDTALGTSSAIELIAPISKKGN